MAPVHVSVDRLKAFLELEGPADAAEVQSQLDRARVVFGVERFALEQALARGTGSVPRCIAKGKAPKPERPAWIELEVDLDERVGAMDQSSGRLDFRERGGMQNVCEGDFLGTLHPAREGCPGTGVDGQPIAPGSNGEVEHSPGVGVRSEKGADGTLRLFADCDGVLRQSPRGELYVSDVLEIRGDVDLQTGNLDVGGSLFVRGTIRAGYRVHARHDIRVGEAVEDADVRAGKSLFVGGGIVGGQAGVVQATEEIRAKFAQNAVLRCGGDVLLRSDTLSGIECKGRLLAREGAGQLRGGTYRAGKGLWARELGSPHGAPTRVFVGGNPGLLRKLAQARALLRAARSGVRKLQRQRGMDSVKRVGQALTTKNAQAVRRSMKALRETAKKEALLQKEQTELEAVVYGDEELCVRVDQTVHAGVVITICDAVLTISRTRSGGTFRLDPTTHQITTLPRSST